MKILVTGGAGRKNGCGRKGHAADQMSPPEGSHLPQRIEA